MGLIFMLSQLLLGLASHSIYMFQLEPERLDHWRRLPHPYRKFILSLQLEAPEGHVGVFTPQAQAFRAIGGHSSIVGCSGNLNLSLPVFKVLGRGGWGVPFALSYNSQNWRQDPGGTWQLGRDIGYCDLNHKMAVLNHNLATDDNDENHLPRSGSPSSW